MGTQTKSMWRLVSYRTIVCLLLSLAVSLPIIADFHFRLQPSAKHWLGLVTLNLVIWASWPRYRWLALRQATTTMTLLIAADLLLRVLPLLDDRAITLAPNMHLRVRHVGEARPGIEGVQEITTDAHGRRVNGPIDYAKKPTDALRIVAIGASTTEQIEIDDRKTWTWLVAEELSVALDRKVEMINTGISGIRGPQYYAALRDSETWSPDVALFLIGINDWNAAIKAANRPLSERILRMFLPFSLFDGVLFNAIMTARGAFLPATGLRPDASRVQEDDGHGLLKLNNSLERPRKVSLHSDSVDGDYASWVGQIMSECKRRAILCMFIEQPTAYSADVESELRRRLWMTPFKEGYTLNFDDMHRVAATYNAFLADAARKTGFPFCVTAPSFPSRLAYFYDDCHFTIEGSRHLANIVGACLLDVRDRFPPKS